MTRSIERYGWKPQLPDHRDYIFDKTAKYAASIDLRPAMPAPYDQGQLGSCTANAIGGYLEYLEAKEAEQPAFTPSRLWIYYYERALEGSINEDAGAEIRDGIKVVATNGYPHETTWPYTISKFRQLPSAQAQADAKKFKALTYYSIPGSGTTRTNKIKAALNLGLPVVFGFTVYDSFEGNATAATGIVTYPKSSESTLGGHAVLIVGYKTMGYKDFPVDQQAAAKAQLGTSRSLHYIVRNSWGSEWGAEGYFYMPSKYIASASLVSDLWVVETTN